MKDSIIYRVIQTESRLQVQARYGRELDFPTGRKPADTGQENRLTPAFDARGLIPCIAQEAATGEVLALGHMDRKALSLSISSGYLHFWTPASGQGGNPEARPDSHQRIESFFVGDDQDCLLVKVCFEPDAGRHDGRRSCFSRRLSSMGVRSGVRLGPLESLE